ncbi:pyrimidine/purine nucleoside phosphorylase [Pelagibaculum spongiae]|uniref:Pyrimidine/purine nucleoside phosphorylase n=1 Tax=Pelagibaculum spongiae TaxID=2080658 RepID=A0A2V1GY79_9GAMM|nr:pyrimidine/purine nucleoside phosphorylase [Pelagibaculum spongiae]PVZ70287.1 hypothetical protein DC094_06725 [Pelagibaculum spongiae]
MLSSNEYFEGKVKSIGGIRSQEMDATIGAMEPGEYQFSTAVREFMTVISGSLNVQLPNSDSWKMYHAGETFEVEANSSFKLTVEVASSYLCRYE